MRFLGSVSHSSDGSGMSELPDKEKTDPQKLVQYWQQSRQTIDKFDNLIYEYTSTILTVLLASVSALTSLLGTTLGQHLGGNARIGLGLVVAFVGAVAIVLLWNSLESARMNYRLMGGAIDTTIDLEAHIFPSEAMAPFRLTRRIENQVDWKTQMRQRTRYYLFLIGFIVLVTLSAEVVLLLPG